MSTINNYFYIGSWQRSHSSIKENKKISLDNVNQECVTFLSFSTDSLT